MFCYQCEQTAKGTGCTVAGVCGKDAETAALQDLLVHSLKELSLLAHHARAHGTKDSEIDRFSAEALFMTLTNVNFNPEDFVAALAKASALRDKAKDDCIKACEKSIVKCEGSAPELLKLASDKAGLIEQGAAQSITSRKDKYGDDITGLQELLTYGLKGVAAYAYHANILGKEDDSIYDFIHEALAYLAGNEFALDTLLGLCLKCGEINLKAMEILDAGNTETYGHPTPTAVRITPLKGKAILVSGHDLKDLEEILKQTEGKGINVYTHGEMLPAHGYPGLKKYSHLAGNYGGAWQDQKKEFDEFPGAIIMTTNCIQKPRESYNDRIFTCNVVGYTGVKHLVHRDFSPAIAAALAAPGFDADGENKTILVGFARDAVLKVAGAVIDAVKGGAVKHFFLIGGCDGAKSGRNYYTDFAKLVPKDCVILTLACGKYRFNKLDFGDISGIPRLLDVGQCNDAYSAIQIAVALAGAFNCGVNELPLSMVLSWYEQKAAAILLTLLYLGIQKIKLGPSLPAFVTPAALGILVEKFNIAPTTTPEEDLKSILG